MKPGAIDFQRSQMTSRQLQALDQPRENGRFARVDGEKLVKDVASFQSGARDLVASLGNLKVSDLQVLFGGKSVTQIRKMGVAARAAVLGTNTGLQGQPTVRAALLGANLGFAPTMGVQISGNPPEIYDDPGVTAFLKEARGHLDTARAAIQGGNAENAPRALTQAHEIADLLLGEDPSNPDAQLVKAEAHKLSGFAVADRRAHNGESPNKARDAVRSMQAALSGFQGIIDQAVEAGIYDRQSNQLTMPNVNKFSGNETLRNLISATADAIYQVATTRISLAEMQGADKFSEANLAALKTAASVSTDLGDPARQNDLVSRSAWSGNDAFTLRHNASVQATVGAVAEYAQGIAARHQAALKADPELRSIDQSAAFQNAIRG